MRILRYFWHHTKNYKTSLFLTILGIGLGSLSLYVIMPYLLSQFIDALTEYASTPSETNKSSIFNIILFLIGNEIVNNVGWRIGGFFNAYFQPSVMRDLEQDCLFHLHKHSNSFFANQFVGGLVSKTNRLVHGFERIADILYWDLFPVILVSFIFLTILFLNFPFIGFVFLAWSIIFFGLSIWFSLWKLKYDKRQASLDSKVTSELADSLSNNATVKIFSQARWEQKLFCKISFERFSIRKFNWTISEVFYTFQGLFMGGLVIFTLYLSAQNFIKGTMTIGSIIFIQVVFLDLLRRLWEISRLTKDFIEALANCEEMIDILHQENDIKDPKHPQKCKINKGHLKLKNLTFTYEDKNTVFKDFNLEIQPGEKVGLVGESGSGKSTLTKILLRFNDIDAGEVLIDGQNIQKIKQDDLRKNISYVPQDSILFHRSLKENIRYGNLKASDADIIDTAKKAHAHEFITKTPEGYETLVGERGIKLSGGERQRISIARAMLKKAPLLILDEATSALDSKAEKLIQKALDEIMKGRTTLVIAHRLSTLRKMDRIIVLDKGQIVETGSHEELLKNKGKYAELWNHQVGGFIE